MKKLVCDRCGYELTEKGDIDSALEGEAAWANAIRAKRSEPRGITPCKHFIRCGGEIILVDEHKPAWWRRWHKKKPGD